MKRILKNMLPLIVIPFACKTNPVVPSLTPPDFEAITYEQTGYNLFTARYSITTNDVSSEITSIVVGEIDNSVFKVADSVQAVYRPSGPVYKIDHEALIPTNPGKPFVTLRTRYYFSSGLWTDHDTTLFSLRYPYPGTELVLTPPPYDVPEDIDIADSVLYGQINDYILMYNMRTQTTSKSILINSYECLTVVDNRYVIYDHANWSLYRFDLLTNSLAMFVYHPAGRFLLGLEFYNGYVYELLQESFTTGRVSLLTYSPAGELLDSVAIGRYVFRLTIHNDTAYVQLGIEPSIIQRVDLSTGMFLDQFKPPSHYGEGIRIRDGYFYFTDYPKQTIARFPLEELFIYGPMAPN